VPVAPFAAVAGAGAEPVLAPESSALELCSSLAGLAVDAVE
jgi:hypothetical protein